MQAKDVHVRYWRLQKWEFNIFLFTGICDLWLNMMEWFPYTNLTEVQQDFCF